MYKVYILRSLKTNKFYVGSTSDINRRLSEHNNGKNKSTKFGIPWALVYSETLPTKQESYKREMQIKSYKGGSAFKKLIV